MQEIPREDVMDAVRRQQYDSWSRPSQQRSDLTRRNLKDYERQSTQESSQDSDSPPRRRRRRYSSPSSSEHSEPASRRRTPTRRKSTNRQGGRAQSEGPRSAQDFRHRMKLDRNWEQNFDKSFDGALAAAAGAGLGAITARAFGEEDKADKSGCKETSWKTYGAALAGAVAANIGAKKVRGVIEKKMG